MMARHSKSIRVSLLLILSITLARLVYLIWVCDYQLVEDEAHYWLWSKALDWSYYSKGPGVAWAIAASTRVFGDVEWAIRLPTVLMSGLGLVGVAMLMRDVVSWARSPRAGNTVTPLASPARVALLSVCALLLAPALQMVGVLMTIDGPYVACWAWACWCGWHAVGPSSSSTMNESGRRNGSARWPWLGLGAAIGLGFAFKYTMLLLVPGLVLVALRRSKSGANPLARRGWMWMLGGLGVAMLGLLPVVIWNAQQGWPTVKHLMGHLGMAGGDVPTHLVPGAAPVDEWSPWWSLELVGQQLGMIGPMLILGCICAWRVLRRSVVGLDMRARSRHECEMYLVLCALPILVFYLLVSLKTEPEGNWPLAGYVTLIPLGAWMAADELEKRKRSGEWKPKAGLGVRRLWRVGIWYGVVAAVMLHFAGAVASGLNRVNGFGPFRSAFAAIIGREPRPIVLGRLYGAREMAIDVDRRLTMLYDLTGRVPMVLAQHYGRASQMAFYLPAEWHGVRDGASVWDQPGRREGWAGRPPVLSAMAQTGGRRSQFDLWPARSLDKDQWLGRDAIILSNSKEETLAVWRLAFGRVEPIVDGVGTAGGQLVGEHKPDRMGFIGFGYRGILENGVRSGRSRDAVGAGGMVPAENPR